MKLTFHGHSCFVVEDGNHRVIIDPFLTGNPTADMGPDDVKVDAILLTHGHGDHVGDTEVIAKANNALIVAPNEIAVYFAKKGHEVAPLAHGGKRTFPFGTVKLTIAFHGSGLDVGEETINGGNPGGLVVTMGGKTFYHAGDTALFSDMKLIGQLHKPDVAAFPIGDNFTMGPEEAILAAEFVGAGLTIPMHYSTFDLIKQDPVAFVKALEAQGQQGKVLNPGESVEI